mmetsp:Transcript_11445/g.30320  ORF Transcript_11445/g.30320 Transcript_11445/m.30320 type:complete len:271 (+) Transcript_11445:255-1067(+)
MPCSVSSLRRSAARATAAERRAPSAISAGLLSASTTPGHARCTSCSLITSACGARTQRFIRARSTSRHCLGALASFSAPPSAACSRIGQARAKQSASASNGSSGKELVRCASMVASTRVINEPVALANRRQSSSASKPRSQSASTKSSRASSAWIRSSLVHARSSARCSSSIPLRLSDSSADSAAGASSKSAHASRLSMLQTMSFASAGVAKRSAVAESLTDARPSSTIPNESGSAKRAASQRSQLKSASSASTAVEPSNLFAVLPLGRA